MKHTQQMLGRGMCLLTAVGVLGASVPLSAVAGGYRARTVLETGTVLPVRLNGELSSNNSQEGDLFTARIDDKTHGYYAFLHGASVDGKVVSAEPRDGDNPGKLSLSFWRLRTQDGRTYPIHGSLISLDNKNVDTRNGRMVAKPSRRNNTLTYVGIGAGVGAVASLLGGGKLRIENLLLGAAAGFGASTLIKGPKQIHDVDLKSGTELGVRLDHRVVTTASQY